MSPQRPSMTMHREDRPWSVVQLARERLCGTAYLERDLHDGQAVAQRSWMCTAARSAVVVWRRRVVVLLLLLLWMSKLLPTGNRRVAG